MKKSLFNYFSIFIITLCCISFFMIHRSFVVQTSILSELNTNKFSSNTFELLKYMNRSYPNASVTSLPMSGIYARYLFSFDETKSALEVLNNEVEFKDYTYYGENLKAIIYRSIGIQDSSFYYSKLAYTNMPGNANHYEQYVKSLLSKKDTLSIVSSLKDVNYKSDIQFAQVFMSACLSLNFSNDSVKKYSKELKNIFLESDEVSLMADYLVYGQKNIQISFDIAKQAQSYFENANFEKSEELFKYAIELNPVDYSNYENLGFTYFKLAHYSDAIQMFEKVISEFSPKTGKSEYLLALSYQNIGDNKSACRLLNESQKFNFKLAFSESLRLCK